MAAQIVENGVHYPVMEQFYTLQGEGYHTGRPSWFLRLGGCDVGCVWCDVKESWDPERHPKWLLDDLVKEAELNAPSGLLVLTGGEPAMYDLNPLTDAFRKAGFTCNIETSGAYELTGDFDWVCLSPKKFKPALEGVYDLANELKVVIYHPSDLAWAEGHAEKVPADCLLYLQPEWSKAESLQPLIIDYIKHNPKWRLSLQTHKYLGIE